MSIVTKLKIKDVLARKDAINLYRASAVQKELITTKDRQLEKDENSKQLSQ
jgi:hypothetical protein